MSLTLTRKEIYFLPDLERVLARRFDVGNERAKKIIKRVLALSDDQKKVLITQILRNYAKRHRSIVGILEKNFQLKIKLLEELKIEKSSLDEWDRMIIGSYFTMEYSIEAAAYFNPSIVLSPDQSQLQEGEKRIILSFRAVGEGHLSSIVFRSGVIDANLDITLEEYGEFLEKPKHVKNHRYKMD